MTTDNFITLITFTYAHEAAVIVSRLESEGIECFLKDEFTAQVNPFYSNAIGGVKLQVRESDYKSASEILIDGGYTPDAEEQVSKNYFKLDALTSKMHIDKSL